MFCILPSSASIIGKTKHSSIHSLLSGASYFNQKLSFQTSLDANQPDPSRLTRSDGNPLIQHASVLLDPCSDVPNNGGH